MDTTAILDAARWTHAGLKPFPDVVAALVTAGVEYYHVDYVALQTTYYGAAGDIAVVPLPYEGLPPVAVDFAAEALRAAIADSQQRGQPHRDFSRRVVEAGVRGYFAFLRGQRVTYLGRQGDQHTEWFPGARPA